MIIDRKTKNAVKTVTYEWHLFTKNYATTDAYISTEFPDQLQIMSEGWYWNKEDLIELRAFIDVLIEEGPWNEE
jgi:hypothetical protein